MESWVKDCAPTSTIPLHSFTDNDSHQTSENSSVLKQLSSLNGSSEEKSEPQSSESESAPSSNFATSTPDFLENASVDSTTIQQASTNVVQPPTLMHETSSSSSGSSGNSSSNSIVGEVPEAMMNEDTSSQPSLDLEGDDSESMESTKKLQTTFQAKDFLPSDSPKSNPFEKELDPEETDETVSECTDNHVSEITSSTIKSESEESVTSASNAFSTLEGDTRINVAEETEKRNFADIGNENNENAKIVELDNRDSIEEDNDLDPLVEEPREEAKEEEPVTKEEELKIVEVDSETPQDDDAPIQESTVQEPSASEETEQECERTSSVIQVQEIVETMVRRFFYL